MTVIMMMKGDDIYHTYDIYDIDSFVLTLFPPDNPFFYGFILLSVALLVASFLYSCSFSLSFVVLFGWPLFLITSVQKIS